MQPQNFLRLVAAVLTLAATAAGAQPVDEERAATIRANYAKFEVRIPVRDGARLFTAVYVPNDTRATYPMLLFRTPYSVRPYGADRYKDDLAPSPAFEQEKFIFVFQDVRGRNMSEGEFVNMRPHIKKKKAKTDVDESTDTYDTIEWLLANVDGHNGRVGQWGISYPGFYSSAGMIDSHPALKAVSPQAPIADWFWDDMHHHGAFILPLAFNFFSVFGTPRPEPTTERPDDFDHGTDDGYQFFLDLGPLSNVNERHFKGEIDFWNQIVEHPDYDEFWQSRNILPHLKNITAAVMVVGGWYDTEDLYGPLKTYRAIERQNPGISNVLVMGPWSHGGWKRTDGRTLGTADFGFNTAELYNQRLLAFFQHFLKGEGDPGQPEAVQPEAVQPEAWMFETGANRWRSFDAWPPPGVDERSLYLGADGALGFEAATADPAGEEAHDAYVSDPDKPVPYTMEITTRWAKKYMTEDQRFAAWRPDVLVYRSEVLADDLTLAGPLEADLWVSTSGTDSDWIVKLIDVYPGELEAGSGEEEDSDDDRFSDEPKLGGQQALVRGEAFRGRFRNSYEQPEPFVPGEVTRVRFELQDVLHTFQRGHRVMVQIQSTWFPFVDRNPGTYVPNIFKATEDDFVTVTNRVYRSEKHPSRVVVGVLE